MTRDGAALEPFFCQAITQGDILNAMERIITQRIAVGDPNLRSIAVVTRYNIHAIDGSIGHIDDFLVQDDNWTIRYIIVDTKNWLPGEKVLISPRAMREIDWETKTFHLNVNRRTVKDSPIYESTRTADGAHDEQFLKYFGINWVEK